MDATLSPYARMMGFEALRDDDGRLVLSMPFDRGVAGRPGFVHGGAIAGLLEAAAYVTLAEALGQAHPAAIKPINVTVSYLRGARELPTHARATIERLGKRVANLESVAWQDDPQKPVAIAQLNILLSTG